ncbi:hypothetical protein Hypma_004348 [Hypsizygus marmoreus]|uniref:Uncharacterized protein n=1 Tax=Hypsizygus marmoreus TaxID=39966 RepID=A0A369K6G6_HYPMA|nr:hypothetical protein Hypma_004348 [Hypsizygus marmoreus]
MAWRIEGNASAAGTDQLLYRTGVRPGSREPIAKEKIGSMTADHRALRGLLKTGKSKEADSAGGDNSIRYKASHLGSEIPTQ